jgi:hypothetical protein
VGALDRKHLGSKMGRNLVDVKSHGMHVSVVRSVF